MRRTAAVLVIAVLAILGTTQATSASASTPKFKNCTALSKSYAHGVGKPGAHDHVSGHSAPVTNFTVSASIYSKNKGLDRDKDGIACEKH